LDINVIIDTNYALKALGIEMIFWQMITMFEATQLKESVQKMANFMVVEDWFNMKWAAHNLKSSAGWVGVSRLHYACYYI